MANKDDYLKDYRSFFEYFALTHNPKDQLPVKLGSYKLANSEVVGAIIDWTTQYLSQKKCPQPLLSPLIKIIIDEVRNLCRKQTLMCGFNPSDNAYEPLRFMQTVMTKTNEICLRYLDNSKLCSLPPPGPPYNVVSACAIKNSRRRMEDRHVIIQDLNTLFTNQEVSPSSYYAIFDGHAGHDAAAYSSAHLHQFLGESKHFISNPELALQDAFLKTDTLFNDKCKVENIHSGTTAVCALLRHKEKTLYIAWVGDSQAVLVSQGQCIQCVHPHKPCREDEKARIEQLGGTVILWGTWRVNGQLAVSRAIGDSDYKPYVTAVPDIIEIPLTGAEDFLILACDGLWDVISEQDAALSVYKNINNNADDIEAVSQHLVQLAKQQGSCDNISVIVVFLREPSKLAAEAHWATRHSLIMDTLDNANATNPFVNSNNPDILPPKDNFVFNLSEGCKQNGMENVVDFLERSANGKRSVDEFDEDDDLGPETDVDTSDEVPVSTISATHVEEIVNNNPVEIFWDNKEEKATLETDSQKPHGNEIDIVEALREETPTPPADSVQDTSGLVDNVAESGEESEDEWNYFKGDQAQKENIDPVQSDKKVSDLTLDLGSDTMSQLNPNAAEFVPISPKREASSPVYHNLMDDLVIAQSPRRVTNNGLDINVPNPQEFETEIKLRPSELIEADDEDKTDKAHNLSSQEIMENLLNGKTIEEIEFQPVSIQKACEFHFGPNSTPFSTPGKLMDQSSAISTKAVFGDESNYSSDFFNDEINNTTDKEDCMSLSFYQDNEEQDLDLNKVQILPENLDEFLEKSKEEESSIQDGPVCDLPIAPICRLPREEPVCDLPVDEPVSNLTDEEPVCKIPVENPVCDLPEQEPICNTSVEEDLICNLSKQDPVCNIPAEDPVCNIPSHDPVCNIPPEDPVCNIPADNPVCDIPVDEPICNIPVEEPVVDIPKDVLPNEPEIVRSELLEPKEIDEIERLSPFKENLSTSSANLGSQSSLPELQSQVPEDEKFLDENLSADIDVRSSLQEYKVDFTQTEERPSSADTKSPILQETDLPQVESPLPIDVLLPTDKEDFIQANLQLDKHTNVTVSFVREMIKPFTLEMHSPIPAEAPISDIPLSPQQKSSPVCSPIQETKPLLLDEPTPRQTEFLDEIVTSAKSPEPVVVDLQLSFDKAPSPQIRSPLSPTKSPVPQSTSPLGYPITQEMDSPIEDVTSSVKDSPLPLASPTEPVNTCLVSELCEVVHESDLLAEITSPKSVIDTESIATTDVNSFLERSLVPDIASPLSGDETHVVGVCNTGLENVTSLIEDLEIKSEIIQPEFPVQVVTTPSQESKSEELACLQPAVETVVAAISSPAAAPVSEKVVEKPKPTATSNTSAKKAPSKVTTATKAPIKGPATKPTATRTTLTSTTKSTQSKTPTSTVNKLPLGSKSMPKDSKPLKTVEKKLIANGDAKPLVKRSTAAPKPLPTATKTLTPKSPTKAATKPTPPPSRPSVPATTKPSATRVTAKLSPATTKNVFERLSMSPVAKTTAPVAPKTSNLLSKPKATVPPAKSKLLPSKPTPKAPDAEKQMKESTNKQITATGTANRISSPGKPLTTARKPKPSGSTVPKTGLDTKKPQELVRHGTNKPKTMAIKKPSKPIANGVDTKVETEFTKDVSPVIENNIVDNSQILGVNNTD